MFSDETSKGETVTDQLQYVRKSLIFGDTYSVPYLAPLN